MRERPIAGVRRPGAMVATHVVLIAGAVVMVGPFVWEVLTSLKTFAETTRIPLTFFPHEWQWSNYSDVFDALPFADMFQASVFTTVGRTLGQLVFCSLAAYAFARMRFRGNNLLFGLFLSVLMVPSQLFLIPQYLIVAKLGWLNSLPGLIVPGMFSAFGTFLLRQFFLTLPRELEEAARLDGANPFQVFWHIALPLAKPGLLALAILTALWSWNDLMYPLVVTTEPDKMPLSAGLATLQGEHFTDYSLLMAGSVMASAPMIIAFIFLQRHFIQGIAFSGTKG
ncbi:carbohydrate ABC transporter permease [Saccharopolyspora shandongensis]|uniref:carbohydrate ABC transporter permease n=1 Tax=Saccharopolyspora shandongensis TaxID=418495 RepID=UPI0034019E63